MSRILVTINGVQNGDAGDAINLVMRGRYRFENGNTYITYNETEETGMEGTTTTIAVVGKRVSIIREGTNKSTLVLEKGKRHSTQYHTPYGSMQIGVTASRIESSLSEAEGRIYAKYLIDIGNQPSGENVFEISYKAV